jgi:excisionase family DNA binding protein
MDQNELPLIPGSRLCRPYDNGTHSPRAIGEVIFDNRMQEYADRLLSTNEAAHYLGLTPNALRIRVHRGSIPAYRLGSRLRFRKRDLDASLQRREA